MTTGQIPMIDSSIELEINPSLVRDWMCMRSACYLVGWANSCVLLNTVTMSGQPCRAILLPLELDHVWSALLGRSIPVGPCLVSPVGPILLLLEPDHVWLALSGKGHCLS